LTADRPLTVVARRFAGTLLTLAALAWPGVVAHAVEAPADDNNADRSALVQDTATVTYRNRDIAVLRTTLAGFTPAQRAEGAGLRLDQALARGGDDRVNYRFTPDGYIVLSLNGMALGRLAPGDADPNIEETPTHLAERVRAATQRAVDETREQADPTRMLRAAGWTLAATLALLAALRLSRMARRRIALKLANSMSRREDRLRIAGAIGIEPHHLFSGVRQVLRAAGWAVGLLALYVWLEFVFHQFPYTRPWGEKLDDWLLDTLLGVALGIAGALPGLAVVALIFFIARFLHRLLNLFIDRVESGRLQVAWLDADTSLPTRRILIFVLWAFALAMAYPYLPGADSEAFKGLSVIVGLMISIGASATIGQALSGMVLIYSRALKPGEYVKIGDTEGRVREIGLFATKIVTGTREEVTLPNATIVATATRNASRVVGGDGMAAHTTVTIGYDAPWRQVHAMLLVAARATPSVQAEPAPFVAQTALSDFYVEYRLWVALDSKRPRVEIMDRLHANIQDEFNRHGVQIMSPHYEGDPDAKVWVPEARWHEPPGDLLPEPPPSPPEK
jgi:small-conductance mechanosensitive channel